VKRGSGLSVWSESSSKIKVTESMTFELLKQDLHLATVVGTRTLVLALVLVRLASCSVVSCSVPKQLTNAVATLAYRVYHDRLISSTITG